MVRDTGLINDMYGNYRICNACYGYCMSRVGIQNKVPNENSFIKTKMVVSSAHMTYRLISYHTYATTSGW